MPSALTDGSMTNIALFTYLSQMAKSICLKLQNVFVALTDGSMTNIALLTYLSQITKCCMSALTDGSMLASMQNLDLQKNCLQLYLLVNILSLHGSGNNNLLPLREEKP